MHRRSVLVRPIRAIRPAKRVNGAMSDSALTKTVRLSGERNPFCDFLKPLNGRVIVGASWRNGGEQAFLWGLHRGFHVRDGG